MLWSTFLALEPTKRHTGQACLLGCFLESFTEGGKPSLTVVSNSPRSCPDAEVGGKQAFAFLPSHWLASPFILFSPLLLPSFIDLGIRLLQSPTCTEDHMLSRNSPGLQHQTEDSWTDYSLQNADSHCWIFQPVRQPNKSPLIAYRQIDR